MTPIYQPSTLMIYLLNIIFCVCSMQCSWSQYLFLYLTQGPKKLALAFWTRPKGLGCFSLLMTQKEVFHDMAGPAPWQSDRWSTGFVRWTIRPLCIYLKKKVGTDSAQITCRPTRKRPSTPDGQFVLDLTWDELQINIWTLFLALFLHIWQWHLFSPKNANFVA